MASYDYKEDKHYIDSPDPAHVGAGKFAGDVNEGSVTDSEAQEVNINKLIRKV